MKKFIFSAFAAFCAMNVCAENNLGVTPCTIEEGATTAELKIECNNTFAFSRLQFDVLLPEGFTPKMNKAGTKIDKAALALEESERTYDEDADEDLFSNASGISYVDNGTGKKVVRFNGAGTGYVQGNSGVLFSMNVVVDPSVAPGVYPVIVNRIKMLDNDGGKTLDCEDRDFVSYIVVGEDTKDAVAFVGEIPSHVNAALATETAITSLDLSKVTASHGDFTYVAGRDVVAPTASVTAKVKFAAPLAGTYSSFCAPVAVTTPCYTLKSNDGSVAVFQEATEAPAGQPVLITDPVNSAAVSTTLVGVESQNINAGYYVANNGSEMHSVNTSATIPALRGYWALGGGSNLRIAIEGPTGIEMIGTADEVFGNSYDLQGRQVQNAKNGVFVVNGKKQFVK